ncbi:hypothetical protein RRG08_000910 [Elysia crispata]|uniref:Uncharacterized protein n=1 Tax=Elysia crispata TaxID=231223 RepID=A0AAE0YKS7_9GAST|nr:hypothetical protein RRG08_000910 [Elysia crispata]
MPGLGPFFDTCPGLKMCESHMISRLHPQTQDLVIKAVEKLDCDLLLSIVPDSSHQLRLTPEVMRTAFSVAVDSLVRSGKVGVHAARMIYLLRNLGAHINLQDEKGNTPLMSYLRQTSADDEVIEAFLRCNADLYVQNKEGESPLEYVMATNSISRSVRAIFTRYVPGIWEAVSKDDAMTVRKLINEWCRVDVQMGGKTLLHLALETGTESIIRVISGIRPSMEFAHSVLAGDTQKVEIMLDLKLKININFRNLPPPGFLLVPTFDPRHIAGLKAGAGTK